jgi:hypothetical protein
MLEPVATDPQSDIGRIPLSWSASEWHATSKNALMLSLTISSYTYPVVTTS